MTTHILNSGIITAGEIKDTMMIIEEDSINVELIETMETRIRDTETINRATMTTRERETINLLETTSTLEQALEVHEEQTTSKAPHLLDSKEAEIQNLDHLPSRDHLHQTNQDHPPSLDLSQELLPDQELLLGLGLQQPEL
jgi:hypothetical protein